MKLASVLTAGFVGFATAAEQTRNAPVKKDVVARKPMEVDGLAAQAMHNLELHYAENPYPNAEKCTLENAVVRREWSTLQKAEKLHYIEAVQCLARLPAKTPASIAAGAKSRYDDLVVTHIQQSLTVHGTGNFLTWHRYFTWAFEQMLKNECGFKGTQPYWNWGYWAENPLDSPLFDGSETSWSGDGAYIANRTDVCFPSDDMCFIQLRPGTGGGCLTSGPFKDWQINMGPLATRLQPPGGIPPNPQSDGLGYNPRCLSRDFSLQAANETRDDQVATLIRDHDSIGPFQTVFGGEFAKGLMGAHTGGHTTTGGDAGSDFMNAPADPVFWPQHAMVDRVYWTWQNMDIKKREMSFTGGTSGIGDGGPPASIDDILTLGDYVGQPNMTIRSAMSTLGGPFCYVYA